MAYDPVKRKIYRGTHKEKAAAYHQALKAKGYFKAYREAHKEKAHAYDRNYRATHKEKIKAYNEDHREQKKAYNKEFLTKLRDEVFAAYGNKCACCSETEPAFLSIDHINGGGNKHRKEIGWGMLYRWLKNNEYPSGFQILCFNCNMAKCFSGICPHQSKKEKTCQNNLSQQEKN